MSDIVEAWLWQPPGDIIERLLQRSAAREQRIVPVAIQVPERRPRDRYYTQARRLHVRQIMRERQ